MWNWLVSALGCGATLVLYDGYPFQRNGNILFDMAENEQVTVFGTSAKFLQLMEKKGLAPKDTHSLEKLRTILSTGSPLLPENYDYVYSKISPSVCLSSISGGTDILGCFALGCPIIPVYRGELQTRSLGLKVEVFNSQGHPIKGEKGELVCTDPFPSMPIYFWNDENNEKYLNSYFSKFKGIWHHGDYVSLTENNGMIFHGRSDTVLNPGGVRIGTAEIYQQVEKFDAIEESIVVEQNFQGENRIILFVKLQSAKCITDQLKNQIRDAIIQNTTRHHLPSKILQVPDIPKTHNGKLVELAVKKIINGEAVNNLDSIANPEALGYFKNLPELQTD